MLEITLTTAACGGFNLANHLIQLNPIEILVDVGNVAVHAVLQRWHRAIVGIADIEHMRKKLAVMVCLQRFE